MEENELQAVEALLHGVPKDNHLEVELPSENRTRVKVDPGAPVVVRPMDLEDELIMAKSGKGQNPMNILLDRCVTNIRVMDLLPMDKLFLIIKIREVSFGDDYRSLLLCTHCGAENPVTIKLSDLPVNPVPDDFSDPVELDLPISKIKAVIRRPRVKDEIYTKDLETFAKNAWRFVHSFNDETRTQVIAKVLDGLPLADVKTIINCFKTDYGVETSVKLTCKECKEESVHALPISTNFFNVS